MSTVLEVKNLSKEYKETSIRCFQNVSKKVLHNISFEIPFNTMTGFLGINGAGKSTTIKCLLELIFPDSGEVLFFGKKLNSEIKKRISYLPEKPQLYDHLTGEEFLRFSLTLSNQYCKKEIEKCIDETLQLVQLQTARKYKLREYSKGMYQRMGLAQAISRKADFIILDEPMSDLDPSGRHLVKKILKNIQIEKKTSIFLSSHLLQDVEDLCQNIVILDKGHTTYSGSTFQFLKKIKPQYEIQYLQSNKLEDNPVQSLVAFQEDLQQEIDKLRKKQCAIVGLHNQNSLEDAFQKFIGQKE